jgi:hypothetical protein
MAAAKVKAPAAVEVPALPMAAKVLVAKEVVVPMAAVELAGGLLVVLAGGLLVVLAAGLAAGLLVVLAAGLLVVLAVLAVAGIKP